MSKTLNKQSGKFIGYLTTFEGSGIVWADNVEEIKTEWCTGMAIFESNGLDVKKLKEAFPEPPERGVVLDYLSENLIFVHQEGVIVGKLKQKRETLIEKTK